MKLDIKSVWTICPSTINFVLPFSIFDLPSKIIFLPKCPNKEYAHVRNCNAKHNLGGVWGYHMAILLANISHDILLWRTVHQWTATKAKQSKVKHKTYQKWVSNTITTARQSHSKATLQQLLFHDRIYRRKFHVLTSHPGFMLHYDYTCAFAHVHSRLDSLAQRIKKVRCLTLISSPAQLFLCITPYHT